MKNQKKYSSINDDDMMERGTWDQLKCRLEGVTTVNQHLNQTGPVPQFHDKGHLKSTPNVATVKLGSIKTKSVDKKLKEAEIDSAQG